MNNRTRLRNLLGAGGLTVLVVATFFVFDGPNTLASIARLGTDGSITALQAQNAELTETLTVMQERETAYQEQVATAEQVIEQLQLDLNSTNGSYEDVLAAYDGSLAELQGQNKELVQSVTTLQERETGWYADVDVANQTIVTLEAQNQELTQAMQGLQGEYETAVNQANQTIGNLEAQLNATYAQNSQLQAAIQAMQARESQFQAQIAQANQAIQQLQNALNNQPSGGGYHEEEHEDDDD